MDGTFPNHYLIPVILKYQNQSKISQENKLMIIVFIDVNVINKGLANLILQHIKRIM